MAKPLKKPPRLVDRKPARAKVTKKEFLESIKRADEWRQKRLGEIKESPR
jgi:hypothetical protein